MVLSAAGLFQSASVNPERFSIEVDGRRVPGALWLPRREAVALVLAGHGGSSHKEGPGMQALAAALTPLGVAMAAIDGPVHGERRAPGTDPSASRDDFRALWRRGDMRAEMTADWRAALDYLARIPALRDRPVGYVGISMGTAYGLPFIAADERIRAAVLGEWGLDYPASEHLADAARKVQCRTMFVQMWNDQIFSREGQFSLFDAIGAKTKKLCAYPGPHGDLTGQAFEDAVAFLASNVKEEA